MDARLLILAAALSAAPLAAQPRTTAPRGQPRIGPSVNAGGVVPGGTNVPATVPGATLGRNAAPPTPTPGVTPQAGNNVPPHLRLGQVVVPEKGARVQTPGSAPTDASAGTGAPDTGVTPNVPRQPTRTPRTFRRRTPPGTNQEGAPPPETGLSIDQPAAEFYRASQRQKAGDAAAVENASRETFHGQKARQGPADGPFTGGVAADEASLAGMTQEQRADYYEKLVQAAPLAEKGRWHLQLLDVRRDGARTEAKAAAEVERLRERARLQSVGTGKRAAALSDALSPFVGKALDSALAGRREEARHNLKPLQDWEKAAGGGIIQNLPALEKAINQDLNIVEGRGREKDRNAWLEPVRLPSGKWALRIRISPNAVSALSAGLPNALGVSPAAAAELDEGISSLALAVSPEAVDLAAEFVMPGRAGLEERYSQVSDPSARRRGLLGRGLGALGDFFISLRSWASDKVLDLWRRILAVVRTFLFGTPAAAGLRVELTEDALLELRSRRAETAVLSAYGLVGPGPSGYAHYPLLTR